MLYGLNQLEDSLHIEVKQTHLILKVEVVNLVVSMDVTSAYTVTFFSSSASLLSQEPKAR